VCMLAACACCARGPTLRALVLAPAVLTALVLAMAVLAALVLAMAVLAARESQSCVDIQGLAEVLALGN